MLFEQLVRLTDVLLHPGGLRAFLSWRPFSITSFRILRALANDGCEFNTIIDGGANKGQFARAATETYPGARVIAFEPLPDVAAQLRLNLADRPQVEVIQSALGNHDGTTEFFRQDYSLASSVLRPIESQAKASPEALTVPICRLDRVLRELQLRPPILLKLDLQGYEIEALKGALTILPKLDHVLVETAFVLSYVGEPRFVEMLDFMREVGFNFVRPIDYLHDRHGTVVQMDALFARHPSADP